MARPQLLLLLAVLLAVAAFASADAPAPKADDNVPSIVDPVAHSPVTDYVDLDEDTGDIDDDEDAAPVGSPLGTTMRPPEKVSDVNNPSSGASIVAGAGATSLAAIAVVAASIACSLVF